MHKLHVSALIAAAVVALAGCGGASNAAGAAPAGAISMNSASCGGSWSLAAPGWHTFELYNANDVGGEVDLVDPATGAIYSEITGFGPRTTVPMSLNVGSGRYAFRCLFADSDPLTGQAVTVAGHSSGATAILPVTNNDLIGPAKQYQSYVADRLSTLAAQTTALDRDVRHGNLAAARRDWLPAHLTYETLGAAYDAFGKFDDQIDGNANALGVTSDKWTGFYRLEYGLWHGQSQAELMPIAGRLAEEVSALLKSWPSTEVPLADLGLRTHEILENALQFQLTGNDDYGSGSTLATTLANITGTRELLTVLHPLLATRYIGLAAVYTWLDRLQSVLTEPRSSREAIDAACGQALQELAPIASITEPRNA